MSKKTLAELKASFDTPERQGNNTTSNNNYYPFWLMDNDQKAVIRFLPDRDENNSRGFLVEKVFHNLVINGQKKKVPCLFAYDGEPCPICKVSQDYYKVEGDQSPNGKKYWRKKQYIAQALVIEDPLPADKESGETHAGKVRNIALGYQLYGIIKEAFGSEDLETIPYDLEEGNDFIIKKTQGQGKHSTYIMGSKFKGASRALSEEELSIVDEDMIELNTLLAAKPTLESLEAQLNADMNGESLNESSAPSTPSAAPAKVSKPVLDDDDEAAPVAPKSTATAETDVDAMLKTIRERKNKK